jgi:acyl dehydratase
MENWHRIHYDWKYATEHDGLPDVMVNGSWKQHVLIQLLADWVGETGWPWRLKFQYRSMNVPGDTLTVWGRVTKTEQHNGFGLVDLDIGLKNQNGVESSPGTATVVLPLRGGKPVPYPFDPRVLE